MDLSKIAWPKPGKYIIGVSGGVDSMVLLHVLAAWGDYELVPVYVDHGWRDTAEDWRAVERLAAELGLKSFRMELELKTSSEEEAREARYRVLREEAKKSGSNGIVTAHHHDDLFETVLINVIRGTGRHGLTPFSDDSILRPMLNIRRSQIELYASEHNIEWAEDPSNKDTKYLRNRIRHELIPNLRNEAKAKIEQQILEAQTLNKEVDEELQKLINKKGHLIEIPLQNAINQTPQAIQEVIVFAARQLEPGVEINRRAVEQLAIDLKNDRLKKPRALSKRLSASASHGTFTIAFKAR